MRAVECDYYTDAITYTKVTILDTFDGSSPGRRVRTVAIAALAAGSTIARAGWLDAGARAPIGPVPCCAHGEVHVVSRVVGFKKIKFYTNENVGSGELDLPEQQMHTTSYWLTIPAEMMAALPFGAADRRDGVVGLAFAMRNVAPLLLMCDRHDLGLSIDGVERGGRVAAGRRRAAARRRPELSAAPTIFLYDNYPGGIGFSEPLFAMHDAARRADARADRRLSVRVRLPVVRRAGRRDRAAGQGRGVAPAAALLARRASRGLT